MCKKIDWRLSAGLFIYSITLTLDQFIDLPCFISGLGLGLSIGLMVLSLISTNNNLLKLRDFKKRILKIT